VSSPPKLSSRYPRLVWVFLVLLVLTAAALLVRWNGNRLGIRITTTSRTSVFVLEDRDPDFRTPAAGDAVRRFGRDGPWSQMAGTFNIGETVGGCRALGASPDGRHLLVAENVRARLGLFHRESGKPVWETELQSKGGFSAAVVSTNGTVYAIASDGTISGKTLVVLSSNGVPGLQVPLGGFDLVLDEARGALWLAGKTVQRLDLQLNVRAVFREIGWGAVSVDLAPDGSAWVAERKHSDVKGSTNRIVQISPEGQVLRTVPLDISPLCVRVEASDGSVWVTGRELHPTFLQRLLSAVEARTGRLPTGGWLRAQLNRPGWVDRTLCFDAQGGLKCDIRRGGFSIALDPEDGSVWIAGRHRITHHSRTGRLLGQFAGEFPGSQKYVITVPSSEPPE